MTAILSLVCVSGALAAGEPPPDPVARLRAEAHAARREQVELLLKAVPKQGCDDYPAAAAAVRRLADEVAAAGDTVAAVRWHEQWAKAVREYLDVLRAVVVGGPGSAKEELAVAEAWLGAEIDLARRRGDEPAALVKLLKERVKLRTKVEEICEKAMTLGGGTKRDYLESKVARLDAEVELATAEAAAKKGK